MSLRRMKTYVENKIFRERKIKDQVSGKRKISIDNAFKFLEIKVSSEARDDKEFHTRPAQEKLLV